jgi:hypothetical protein
MNVAAIRDQPVNILDADGKKICSVKAGPRTDIAAIKKQIQDEIGTESRLQMIMSGSYEYTKNQEHAGIAIFKTAMEKNATPELNLVLLSAEDAAFHEARHKVIEAIDHGTKLHDIEEIYRDDADIVLHAVEHANPSELQYASERVRSDMDHMLAALKISGTSMYYVHETLWKDRAFMKGAMQIDGLLLGASMVPAEWRSDAEIVMYACENHGYALKHATQELKNNRSIVMAAVCQRGTALMYASLELREDYYVVLDAVRNNRMAIVHAKGDLREDDDIRAAAGQGPSDKMLDHDKLDKIKAKFHELDANGDGFLSYEEMYELLKRGNPDMAEEEIRLLYDQMDTHRDNRVDFHEFCDFIFKED